ncbi:oxidoreductase [Pseudomonas sp. CGJS7]|uniref:oxidoreductase n=1 Tax=Pseudomonas sp. CGJS7 TaxID=3109348 RepID=UPI00300AACBE
MNTPLSPRPSNGLLSNRTALVTGASAGIGEAIALRLAALGATTYAAARRTERMRHLQDHGVRVLPLDLTDEASIRACADSIAAEHGGIDILVNNAGYGSYGSVEEVPMDDARRQIEVNLFGLAALSKYAIPHMRAQRWGKIFNITSVGGLSAAPYGGWYHASKFAVEGLSSSLRQELSPFGVDVVLVRPGAIKTEWAGIAADSLLRVSGDGPYAKAVRPLHALFTGEQLQGMAGTPDQIADTIEQALRARRPRSAYIAPRAARTMIAIGRLLGSDRLRDRAMRAFMRLPATM